MAPLLLTRMSPCCWRHSPCLAHPGENAMTKKSSGITHLNSFFSLSFSLLPSPPQAAASGEDPRPRPKVVESGRPNMFRKAREPLCPLGAFLGLCRGGVRERPPRFLFRAPQPPSRRLESGHRGGKWSNCQPLLLGDGALATVASLGDRSAGTAVFLKDGTAACCVPQ